MSFFKSIDQKHTELTRFPRASLRELVVLSIPLMFVLFSGTMMGFCDRWFLAQSSTQAMEASISATYLCMFFQAPCIRVTSVSQIFVGQNFGAKRYRSIGENVWQMIWFSFFTMCITYPLSFVGEKLFFSDTSVHESASIYFRVLMLGNFLFPLSIALGSFFVGQGRTKVVFLTTVSANILNVFLDILLIFGVPGLIPELGILGAAIGTVISHLFLCATLFIFFFHKNNRERFGTDQWRLRWDVIKQNLKVGVPRAVTRIIVFGIWLCTARVMMLQGGNYLLVLSVGGSIALLFSFIGEGMLQALVTIGSNIIGAAQYHMISRMTRSALLYLALSSCLLLIPLVLYPKWILSFLIVGEFSSETWDILYRSCYWLWFYFFAFGVNAIGHSFLVASKDTFFHMVIITFNFITTYVPLFLAVNFWSMSPDKLWLIMALDSLIFGAIFLIRFHKKSWKRSVIADSATN